jgi:hypothetical protein
MFMDEMGIGGFKECDLLCVWKVIDVGRRNCNVRRIETK